LRSASASGPTGRSRCSTRRRARSCTSCSASRRACPERSASASGGWPHRGPDRRVELRAQQLRRSLLAGQLRRERVDAQAWKSRRICGAANSSSST
jgi:hypothetical protein